MTRREDKDMRRVTGLASVMAVMGAMFLTHGQPIAREPVGRGTIGARTEDNLRVPQGATCTLNGTRVKGTVKVERAATLWASGIRVVGNVQAENARNVVVRRASIVGGSVQIVQGGTARILGSRINGDILFDDQARALRAGGNRIGGNLRAFQNTGGVRI